MRHYRIVLSVSILLLATLACNAATGIRTAQTDIPAALTEAPGMLTNAPTMLSPMETSVAEFTPPPALMTALPGDATAPAGTLGIKLQDVKTVLGATQQFVFSDDTVNGKPAAIVKLSSTAAASFPSLTKAFSVAFIGDAANLNEIKVVLPPAVDQQTVDEGVGLVGIVFAGILPADVQVGFLEWIAKTYSEVPVGGSKETTVKNFKFSLSRTDTNMTLDILPAK